MDGLLLLEKGGEGLADLSDFDVDDELRSTQQEVISQEKILAESREALKALKEELKVLEVDIEEFKLLQQQQASTTKDEPVLIGGKGPLDPTTTILSANSAAPTTSAKDPCPMVVDIQSSSKIQSQQQSFSVPVGILGATINPISSGGGGGGGGRMIRSSSASTTDFVSTQGSAGWQDTDGGFTSNMFVSTHDGTVGSTSLRGATPVGGLDEASGVNMNVEDIGRQGSTGGSRELELNSPQLLSVFSTTPNTTPKGESRTAPGKLPIVTSPPSGSGGDGTSGQQPPIRSGDDSLLKKKLRRKKELITEIRTLTGMKASAKVYRARCQAKVEDLKLIKAEREQRPTGEEQGDVTTPGNLLLPVRHRPPQPDGDGLLILSANIPNASSSNNIDHVLGSGRIPMGMLPLPEEELALMDQNHLCGSPVQALRAAARPPGVGESLRLTSSTLAFIQHQLKGEKTGKDPTNPVSRWCLKVQEESLAQNTGAMFFAPIPDVNCDGDNQSEK